MPLQGVMKNTVTAAECHPMERWAHKYTTL